MGLQCSTHFCVETPPLSLCFLVWGWGLSRVLIVIVRAGQEPPLLYTVVCVFGGKCANSSYIPLLTDLGTGGSAEKSARKGYYTVLVDAPQTKGAQSLDFYL